MCDMAHDGDGATEGSFTSDEEGMIYVVLQMAVWVMDEVRCVELQTAVQHEYGGASSIFILEVKFPGDDDWSVVAMKSLTADYADGTVNSSYTFAPGLRQLKEDISTHRELEVARKLEAAPAEAEDSSSSNRRHLAALVCPAGYYDSTNGNSQWCLLGSNQTLTLTLTPTLILTLTLTLTLAGFGWQPITGSAIS